eukprot:10891868-Lingulodinium_polyedra.AAC.1
MPSADGESHFSDEPDLRRAHGILLGSTWNGGHNAAFAVGLSSVTDARNCGHNTAFAVGLSSLSDARA